MSTYHWNPELCMSCDIALCQNPLRQKNTRVHKLSTLAKMWAKGDKMYPTSKLIIQMHETRSPTKCKSTVQAEISDGRKNSSLKH